MQIEDPHGVGDIVPALTQDQRDIEELQFRILTLSFLVQQYGNWMTEMAQIHWNSTQQSTDGHHPSPDGRLSEACSEDEQAFTSI